MKAIKILFSLLSLIFLVNIACNKDNSDTNQQLNPPINPDSLQADEKFETAKEIFYSLPAPNEVSMILLENDDISYDETKLNPVSNAEKYSTDLAKALNLGIYSADLSYASLYEQNQTVVNYMAIAKKIAESLGILEAFDENTINRLENNFNNRDSILDIISKTYMKSDAYLKENNREEVASLIMIGGWVEGLYLALSIAKDKDYKNEVLCSNIIEQELSLELIVDFLNNFKQKKLLKKIEPDIQKIAEQYKKISENSTINQEGNLEVPIKYLEDLYTIVSEIRNKYVNLF